MRQLILLTACLTYVFCIDLRMGARSLGDELLHIQYEQTNSITAIRQNVSLHFIFDGTIKYHNLTSVEFDLFNVSA